MIILIKKTLKFVCSKVKMGFICKQPLYNLHVLVFLLGLLVGSDSLQPMSYRIPNTRGRGPYYISLSKISPRI